jgi:hypothetical protein
VTILIIGALIHASGWNITRRLASVGAGYVYRYLARGKM